MTDEFILGFDREIGLGFAVGANYVWRKYGDFQWNDRVGITTPTRSDTFTPPPRLPGRGQQHQRGELSGGHVLPADVPAADDLPADERPGFDRVFNGFELTGA